MSPEVTNNTIKREKKFHIIANVVFIVVGKSKQTNKAISSLISFHPTYIHTEEWLKPPWVNEA